MYITGSLTPGNNIKLWCESTGIILILFKFKHHFFLRNCINTKKKNNRRNFNILVLTSCAHSAPVGVEKICKIFNLERKWLKKRVRENRSPKTKGDKRRVRN